MRQDRWTRALIVMLVVVVGLYLLEKAWGGLMALRSVLIIFLMAALLSYFLQPVVDWLAALHLPGWSLRLIARRAPRLATRLGKRRLGNSIAVALVYLGLLVITVLTALYYVPLTVRQLSQFGKSIPDIVDNVPRWLDDTDAWLRSFGIDMSISTLYNVATLQTRIEAAAGQLLQYVMSAATTVASAVATALLVLAVSFYMMLDGRRFVKEISRLVPRRFQDEFRHSSKTFDDVFGGFARVQALMALLYAAGVGIVTSIAGIPYSLSLTWICGVVMLIPLVGAPIAMVLPALLALFSDTGTALWILIVLVVYQNLLLQLVGPIIQSQSMRIPTILVLASALIGGVLMGVWGVIFGVPIGAVIYSLIFYFVLRHRRKHDSSGQTREASSAPRSTRTTETAPPETKPSRSLSESE